MDEVHSLTLRQLTATGAIATVKRYFALIIPLLTAFPNAR